MIATAPDYTGVNRQAAPGTSNAMLAFLRKQAGGAAAGVGHAAGFAAPAIQTVAQNQPAVKLQAPTLAPAQGQAQAHPVDYNQLTSYYSDPAHAEWRNDPALLQIQQQGQTNNANAESGALAAREQLLAQFGDQGLARSVLGNDDPTLGAISADPDKSTSVLARLARGYRDTVANNEDQRNKANLWYSSERARGLTSDAQDYATEQADAVANARQALDQITAQLAAAKGATSKDDEQALSDAFQRYLAAISAQPATATPGTGPGGNYSPTDLQAGVDTPDANGIFPSGGSPFPVSSPAAPAGGLSANPGQGVFGVDLGAMDYPHPQSPMHAYMNPYGAQRDKNNKY